MMTLYSGITCPFSQRCRFVLYEKGMDFEIKDVDIFNKPEDLAVMNPYNQVPVLVERDLILHESNIINEYIDERFPHPQLMPGDPVMRGRGRLVLYRMEKELFGHVKVLEMPDRCGLVALTVALGSLRHQIGQIRRIAAEIRRAYFPARSLYRSLNACRKSHAPLNRPVSATCICRPD